MMETNDTPIYATPLRYTTLQAASTRDRYTTPETKTKTWISSEESRPDG